MTVLGSSDKSVIKLNVFDADIELVFVLDPLKNLNMTGLMDYHWGSRFDLLKTSNARDQVW